MPETIHTIEVPEQGTQTVVVRRDRRLKRSARWQRQPDGSLLLRIPARMPKREIPALLASIRDQLLKQKKKAIGRTDADLQERAVYLNAVFFNNRIQWQAIRWVKPMNTRLGSCTTGGPTDGHIRISEEIRDWPQWVVDYVIAHEMAHRLHPNHSKVFWQTLQKAYPRTEQARGFVKGYFYARGRQLEEESENETD